MAIKSINGKNVYVIDVQVPTPRTSTGQSFGNLVSDLRWDLFDKIQKDIIRSGEIQKLGYQSEYEAYIDLKKSYQDQIANLNELKAKVITGGAGSSEYLKTLRADAKNRLDYWKASGGAAGKVETVTYPKGYEAISPFGTVKSLERGYQKTTSPMKGQALQGPITVFGEGGISPDDAAAQAGQAAQSQAQGIQNATDFIDQEIERLRLEQEGLKAPTYAGITDFTTAARKGFATAMGTGGFGLQQRPGKVQPTFYEGEATAALDKIQSDYEQKELLSIKQKKIAERNAIEARLNKYRDNLAQLQNISDEFKTDADKAEIARLQNIISRAEAEINKKFVDPNTGSLRITDQDLAQARTNAADRMTSDFDLLGSRSVSRRGFLGYPEAPEITNERVKKERERKQRMPQNPPGTDRGDPFFEGPRGVNAPDAVAKLTASKPQEVFYIEGEGPYSRGAIGSYEGPPVIDPNTGDYAVASTDPFFNQSIAAAPGQSMLKTKYRQPEKVPILSIPTEDYNIPVGPSSDKITEATQRMIDAKAQEDMAAQYGEVDTASARAAAAREAEFRALLGEDYQQMPRPAVARSSFGRMERSPRAEMLVESRGGESVPAWRRPAGAADQWGLNLREQARLEALQPENITIKRGGKLEVINDGLPPEDNTLQDNTLLEDINIRREKPITSEPADQSKVIPTRQSRRDLYLARTIKKGIQLANKPAKIERLAKTKLPEKERSKVVPEAIAVVDKIYEINRGKPNAFKLSFDEISRAFANKPKERQQAHEYLVAKDMLEGDKAKPLA